MSTLLHSLYSELLPAPVAYTTQEEFGYMKLEKLAFMYTKLEGDRAIKLFTESQVLELVAKFHKELVTSPCAPAHPCTCHNYPADDEDGQWVQLTGQEK